jgi:hypothetical protein
MCTYSVDKINASYLYWMKKMFDVPMSSSLSKIVSHVWVCGAEKGEGWEKGEGSDKGWGWWLVGNKAVTFHHETRVE